MDIDNARCVAVVGAGAAGTLTAARLLAEAGRRGIGLDIRLVDPASSVGRGVAYSTEVATHLLNVRAGAMSAYPEEPDHFLRWLANEGGHPETAADDFVPRGWYGRYLGAVLETAARNSSAARLRRVGERVAGVERTGAGATLTLASGRPLYADAVVLALGNVPPGCDWAPAGLRSAPGFVADPWDGDALDQVPPDADVLLVGTGLTMVDVALVLARPGRVVHAVSRHGLVPRAHTEGYPASLAAPVPPAARDLDPDLALAVDTDAALDLDRLRRLVRCQVSRSRRRHGDWRPGIDGLRPFTAALWQRLSEDDRLRLLREDLRDWEVHRHRMPPRSASALDEARAAGQLRIGPGEVADVSAHGDRIRVSLVDGRVRDVAAVVNCTGSSADLRRLDDPLVAQLLASGLARPGPAGLGFDTAADGRLLAAADRGAAPLWTLGALRRGNLLETTAVPEIRVQARSVATAVVESLERGRRRTAQRSSPAQCDPHDLRRSTTPEATRL
ncbi:FAD/NAD(P)-binding protein [Kitasatospora sp. NPDC018058]|uniref:FAD/NAD(P)-binding protein n=1 Tax=Kitasatospora sp. NPDC018058 TaxID=3364025 RepID=UPI0037C027FC